MSWASAPISKSRLGGLATIRGFTLAELVMVLVIVSVLAVAAISRFFDRQTFESRGFYDETLAALRYAQKTAIAQRRNVCVAFSTGSATLTIASASGIAAPCNTDLTGPTGTTPFVVTARSGVTFAALPTNFQFSALGQASLSQTMQVVGATGNIVVEKETGYVHP